MLTRCAVLGSPIAHSLSPVLHHAAYAELGLDWRYDAIEVTESSLRQFLAGLGPQWRGLSLTMPLKRAVLPLADTASDTVRTAGAANTLLLGRGGRDAHNTDVPGAVAALLERGVEAPASAAILGGGATATSVLLALSDLGCGRFTLVVRDQGRAADTVAAAARHPSSPAVALQHFDAPAPEADVLVSTIPAAAQRPEVVALAANVPAVFDVIYHPWPTPLARFAIEHGRILVSGLDLLVHQAARQVALMTGAEHVPLVAMRRAGEAALRSRS